MHLEVEQLISLGALDKHCPQLEALTATANQLTSLQGEPLALLLSPCHMHFQALDLSVKLGLLSQYVNSHANFYWDSIQMVCDLSHRCIHQLRQLAST